ncbi:MAG: PilZ domain-containing protein [Ruminococcus sp.]|jgi:hypothetical protein|nr:PilZ domain-containing protein [Ruminococcus sp.]
MINKERIQKLTVYDNNDRILFSVPADKISFPKDFFRIKKADLVVVKSKDLPVLFQGSKITVIFEYLTGLRMKYMTEVDLGSETQMNFHVGDGLALEERRRFYKVPVDFYGTATYMIRDEEITPFDPPLPIHFSDLNLGGIFFSCEAQEFVTGDQLQVIFIDGEMSLLSEILRVQKNPDGSVKGYGAKFLVVTGAQEERLSRFIFDCQLAERERRRKKEELQNSQYQRL